MSGKPRNVTHREKVDRLLSELTAKGISQYTIAPPMFRMFWKLGIEIPPPFFIPFLPLALLFGLPFGATMAIFFWLSSLWLSLVWSEDFFFVILIGSGAAGLTLSAYCRLQASRLRLNRWNNYGN
jgi:hypothetical protein